jgi:DNA-binding transcriptional ArsR family regulator
MTTESPGVRVRRSTRRGPPNKIDGHPAKAEIELAIAIGESAGSIAKRFDLAKSTVRRHVKRLPPYLKAAALGDLLAPGRDLEALKVEEGKGLIALFASQRARCLLVQDKALELGEHQLALQASREIIRVGELLARYLGKLDQHSTSTAISVIVSPEYLKLRNAVVQVLRAYPEALAELTSRLQAIEADAIGVPVPAAQTPALIEHQP